MKFKSNLFLLAFFSFFLMMFIFNDLGLMKLYKLNQKKKNMRIQIDNLITKEETLINEIENLTYNDGYIKKIARSKFHLVKPGEKIYKVIDRKSAQN
tara:strand:+ start:53 stop:343 length:291 start_codon:yes stop_codon:yes gene_type:complete